jgi:hypothetical protein
MNTFTDFVTYFERMAMQWIVQSYQKRTLRWAVRKAYRSFARQYPHWVAALFDEYFVLTHVLPRLQQAVQTGDKVTPIQIADLWAKQVSMLPTLRQQQMARIVPATIHFLGMVTDALAETKVDHNPLLLVETAVG